MKDIAVSDLPAWMDEIEARLAALEAAQNASVGDPLLVDETVKVSASPRATAIQALQTRLQEIDPNLRLEGFGNRGTNALVLVGQSGVRRRIYLSSSKNYAAGSDGYFSSWHTIKPADIEGGEFAAYVLMPFIEEGEEPEFFVLSPEEMREHVADKSVSGGHYYFYISPNEEDPGGFLDKRKESVSDSDVDFSSFHEAWNTLLQS